MPFFITLSPPEYSILNIPLKKKFYGMLVLNRSSEEKRRNQEEVSDEIKRKMDGAKRSYQEEILRLNRAHEREKENFKDKLNKDRIEWEKKFQYERERLENKMQVKLSDVFREHRDEVNKLEKRLQKQFAEVENQKIIMTAKLDRQKVHNKL